MRARLLALLLLAPVAAARAQDSDDAVAIQRHLMGLRLGDGIEDARRAFPPAQEWPSTGAPRGVTRYRLTRETAKSFPRGVETLYLGYKKGRLVEIEVDYDETQSRAQPIETLAGEYALTYGEARRTGERFLWSDRKTVLRVFHADIPLAKDGDNAVAWRTAVQIFDRGLLGGG